MSTRFHKKVGRMLRQPFRNKILSKYGKAVLADTWNGLLLVEAGDFAVARKLLDKGEYDRQDIEWLTKNLGGSAGHIVVVGAHIGSLLIPLSKISERVTGFEADLTNFELVSRNLLLNQVTNAKVNNKAVGASAGEVTVRRNRLNTGNSSISLKPIKDLPTVDMVTLDSWLADDKDPVSLMVMDIEGHELHALKGGKNTLERTEMLYIEYSPSLLKNHDSTGVDLLEYIGRFFSDMYILHGGVQHYSVKEGMEFLASISDKRGLLRNLLFTKKPLHSA
ncbi:FkbM family methyltransferase [Pseudidiomarina sp.]|uniref:FkbM family methyltransferase n=1 Tax=Pseudidiomarina sp. TaxID=2081707 RepID=UPI00299D4557|nr:FkbM family methyltransferase [Pseudidiomarina sp.]MDX1705435.1 FkbM family methyltransferase [Pseudidiomarina sp.]